MKISQYALFIFIVIALCVMLVLSQKGTQKMNDSVVICFGGDTMLGRLVNDALKRLPREIRFTYPWGNILPDLKKADLRIINLETAITTSNTIVPKVFNFKTDPEHVQVLKAANIDVVNLANNHSLDFGITGLKETISTLDAAGIRHVGAGENEEQALVPVFIEKNGITFGILGYTDNEPTWKAEPHKPGTNYIKVGDIERVRSDVAAIRNNVDIVIVTIHWGPNMQQRPTQEFKNFAHAMIEAGVDIIHGHSAHVFQGIETYKNKVIMYDTGDLVDDYRVDPMLRNDLSFLFFVTCTKSGPRKIELVPTLIENMQVNHAIGSDKELSLKRMQNLSAEMGTTIGEDGILEIS